MRRAVVLIQIAGLLLAGCGTSAPTQGRWQPNGAPRNEDWHSPSGSLLRFDANRDADLARGEAITGLQSEFRTYDSDHDNCLAPDEVRAINQGRLKQDASQAMPLVDWNLDACVDFKEFSGATLSLFDSLDADSDGHLTALELHPGGPRASGSQPANDERAGPARGSESGGSTTGPGHSR